MIIFEEQIVVTSLNQTYRGSNLDHWLNSSKSSVSRTQSCCNWRTDGLTRHYYCFARKQKEKVAMERSLLLLIKIKNIKGILTNELEIPY